MRDHLVFYVNGARHVVRGEDAALSLSDYLRSGRGYENEHYRLAGTKVACAEGDCGACTVLVGDPNVAEKRFEFQTIDACIAFVYQMDRRHIITVEGLQSGEILSEVQTAMVNCHGSQCGFCTPGFVMALHGLLEEQDCQKSFSDDDLRLGLSGNLCRCTGYSQILDAGRSFDPSTAIHMSERFNTTAILTDFSKLSDGPVCVNPQTKHNSSNAIASNSAAPEIFLPSTLTELLERRAERPKAILVSGATDLGVQFNHGKVAFADVIVTAGVSELGQLRIEGDELAIGATASWSRIEAFTRDRVPEYSRLLTRFGSPQVRHAGTLIGNLANASPIADSIPFHYVTQSTLKLASVRGRRNVPIENFYLGYKQLDLKPDEVIFSVRTPLPSIGQRLKLYKVSKRRDMDISTVTAAFLLEFHRDIIRVARIAIGGVGPTVVRLPESEALLVGKALTVETMQAAGRIARQEITPISDVRGSANYRLQLVENLFTKCFHDLCQSPPLTVPEAV